MTILKLGGSKLSRKILHKINAKINDELKDRNVKANIGALVVDLKKGRVTLKTTATFEADVKSIVKMIEGS